MANLSITLTLVIVLSIVQHFFSDDAAAQSAGYAMPDFTGTYATEPPAPNCSITTTSAETIHSGMRAIHIDQSGNVLTVRNTPAQNVRILYIQSRRHAAEPLAPMRNGLARWDGDAIVVASQMPALPLWSHRRSPQFEGALFERFSVTDGIHFTYRAWYEPSGEFTEALPFEVTLTKCAGVVLDVSDRP